MSDPINIIFAACGFAGLIGSIILWCGWRTRKTTLPALPFRAVDGTEKANPTKGSGGTKK